MNSHVLCGHWTAGKTQVADGDVVRRTCYDCGRTFERPRCVYEGVKSREGQRRCKAFALPDSPLCVNHSRAYGRFAASAEAVREARDKADAKARHVSAALRNRLLQVIGEQPGVSGRVLQESVGGNAAMLRKTLHGLVADGTVTVKVGERNTHRHYVSSTSEALS